MTRSLYTVPASSIDLYQPSPAIINPDNERIVDVQLGTDSAILLTGLVNPGEEVGDELMVRLIPRAKRINNGVDVSNKASLNLKVITPGSRIIDDNYLGFGRLSYFGFPAFSIEPTFVGPAIALFRWSGVAWLPVLKHLPQS